MGISTHVSTRKSNSYVRVLQIKEVRTLLLSACIFQISCYVGYENYPEDANLKTFRTTFVFGSIAAMLITGLFTDFLFKGRFNNVVLLVIYFV